MSAIEKAVPVLLRDKSGQREILVFRHPRAGIQIVKGGIEPGESAEAAALRELAEEAGVTGARIVRELGRSEGIAAGETWHFLLCEAPEQPARWIHAAPDDGGLILSFSWHRLDDPPGADWHEVFVRALDFIRAQVG